MDRRTASTATATVAPDRDRDRARDDDVAGEMRRVRSAVVAHATGAYLVTMAALTSVAATAVAADPTVRALVVLVAGGLLTIVTARALARLVRRLDAIADGQADRAGLAAPDAGDAARDGLTGLGNHRAFRQALDRSTVQALQHGQPVALVLLDVDDLKRLNEVGGHEAGDEVLMEVAAIVAANVRRGERAFRIGGDEFAIICPGSGADRGLEIGRRVLAGALDGPRRGAAPSISLTVGISAIPELSPDRAQLLRHAEAALHWGKRHGRTDIQVFDAALHAAADLDRPAEEIVAAIDRLVGEKLLRPVFQPVYSLADGACLGFEGLIRPHPSAGFPDPGALFAAAERVGRTVELDIAAVRAIAAAATGIPADRYLAVNLSPRTLETAAFNPHELLAILGRAGLTNDRIVVEITEREAVEDMEQLTRTLQALRRMGVRIAADDVGAGNAGLQLLSRIDFDIIKIDLSLVRAGAVRSPSQAVMRAIIEMAERRGATTVAEGIETPSELGSLVVLGVAVGQGYLLGMPAEQPDPAGIDIDALLAGPEVAATEGWTVGRRAA